MIEPEPVTNFVGRGVPEAVQRVGATWQRVVETTTPSSIGVPS